MGGGMRVEVEMEGGEQLREGQEIPGHFSFTNVLYYPISYFLEHSSVV